MAMAAAAILASFLLCAVAVRAADHVVGDTAGWQQGQNYSSWASAQTFTVGDNLVFTYGSNHNVNEVDKNGYDNCVANGTPHTGGNTTIPLTTPGSKYYICSISNHCSAGGMKLTITVLATGAGTPTTPPPSGSPPSTTPSPPSSSPSPPSPPSPPPPPSNGAPGSFGSQSTLVVGFSLVIATLLAFMG